MKADLELVNNATQHGVATTSKHPEPKESMIIT